MTDAEKKALFEKIAYGCFFVGFVYIETEMVKTNFPEYYYSWKAIPTTLGLLVIYYVVSIFLGGIVGAVLHAIWDVLFAPIVGFFLSFRLPVPETPEKLAEKKKIDVLEKSGLRRRQVYGDAAFAKKAELDRATARDKDFAPKFDR